MVGAFSVHGFNEQTFGADKQVSKAQAKRRQRTELTVLVAALAPLIAARPPTRFSSSLTSVRPVRAGPAASIPPEISKAVGRKLRVAHI